MDSMQCRNSRMVSNYLPTTSNCNILCDRNEPAGTQGIAGHVGHRRLLGTFRMRDGNCGNAKLPGLRVENVSDSRGQAKRPVAAAGTECGCARHSLKAREGRTGAEKAAATGPTGCPTILVPDSFPPELAPSIHP